MTYQVSNVSAPAANGSGSPVDLSALGAGKTITVTGSWSPGTQPTTTIEINNDATSTNGSWSAIATLQGAGTTVVDVACRWMRATVSNFQGGMAPVVAIGAADAGATFVGLAVPASAGSGAASATGALGAFRTVQVGGTFGGALSVDMSTDGGTTWSQALTFQVPGVQSVVLTAGHMRVTRSGSVSGSPVVNIGGADLPGSPEATVTVDGQSITGNGTIANPLVGDPGSLWVTRFGAVGDWDPRTSTGTDNRSAFTAAVAAAIASGKRLVIPPGNYRISRYVLVDSARQLEIVGSAAARIYYASDDTSSTTDSVATTLAMARSAFLLKYCQDVTFRDLELVGDNHPCVQINTGCGVFANHTVGLRMIGCTQRFGQALYNQDAASDTAGTGDSIAVASGLMTLTDAAGLFKPGHVGRMLTVANATNTGNNGVFEILQVVSATQLVVANAGAVAESSALIWSIDDHDRDTRIEGCSTLCARGILVPGPDTTITGCRFEQPMTRDETGIPTSFSISGTTVTLTDGSATWNASHVGRYIKVAGTTNNNGTFRILSVTPAGRYVPGTVTYTNASGLAEQASRATATWWIPGGDKVGLGAGAGGLAKSGSTMTLTSNAAAFSPDDVGRIVHINNATSLANYGAYVVTGYVSATQIQYVNSGGVAETFSGIWQIDSYDSAIGAEGNYGSTHAIYAYAGRENVAVDKCTFVGIRKTAIKASGSAFPIRNIRVTNCYARECGVFVAIGADDVQEHSQILVADNHVIDCGTGRLGWNDQIAFDIMGARDVTIARNQIRYTHNSISWVDQLASTVGRMAISCRRYYSDSSQPLQNVLIAENTVSADNTRTYFTKILEYAVSVRYAGMVGKSIPSATLTKNGTTMTLTSSALTLSQENVGNQLVLSNCTDAGNNGSFKITSVIGQGTLTFENAAGVASAAIGFGRIRPDRTHPLLDTSTAFSCKLDRNTVLASASQAFYLHECNQPEITNNTFGGCTTGIRTVGCALPVIRGNTEAISISNTAPAIVLGAGTSFPIVHDNYGDNPANSGSTAMQNSLKIGDASVVACDYPLLGKSGRCRPTNAQQELVIAYGAGLVDGDWIQVGVGASWSTFTYKATSPGANQFNSFAGLVALINTISGLAAADYGTGLAGGNVDTRHIRIRGTSQTTTDGAYWILVDVMNPTALVVLRNGLLSNVAACYSRGGGSAGPTPDKTVVWSPLARWTGPVQLLADNASARTLLATGYLRLKNSSDDGCDILLQHDTSAGTEEMRWSLS